MARSTGVAEATPCQPRRGGLRTGPQVRTAPVVGGSANTRNCRVGLGSVAPGAHSACDKLW